MTRPLVPFLVGPTGSGKTEVGLALARLWGAEVVSADARQGYREFTIGTAKPRGAWTSLAGHPFEKVFQVAGVTHHLVDVRDPQDVWDAGAYARDAGDVIEALHRAGRRVVVVGGTGLYLKALVDGLAPLPPGNPVLRQEFIARAQREGRRALWEELSRVDPLSASRIPPNNLQRVSRALEVWTLTQKPLSALTAVPAKKLSADCRWFGLRWPTALLQDRLLHRAQAMVEEGLVEEARALAEGGVPLTAPAWQSLGYVAALACARGEIAKEVLVGRLYGDTRRYAKRQMTWFRGNPRIRWIDLDNSTSSDDIAAKILRELV